MSDALDCGCEPEACPLRLLKQFLEPALRIEAIGGPSPKDYKAFLAPKARACQERRAAKQREREARTALARSLIPIILEELRKPGVLASSLESRDADVRSMCLAIKLRTADVPAKVRAWQEAFSMSPFDGRVEIETNPWEGDAEHCQATAYYRGPPKEEAKIIIDQRVAAIEARDRRPPPVPG